MTPQPMSDAEISHEWGRALMSHDTTREHVCALARAIEARVNAQWVAMLGEPVATLVGYSNGERELRFNANGWGDTHTPLYAIKETP